MNESDHNSRLAALEAIVPRIEKTISESIDNLSSKIDSFTKELKSERRDENSRIYVRIAEFENKLSIHEKTQAREYERFREELGFAILISKHPITFVSVILLFAFLVAFFGRAVWDFVHLFL